MKNLIFIENGEKYYFDTLEELVRAIIKSDYYELEPKLRSEILELKAYANCMPEKLYITDNIEKDSNIEGKFIILDEITYILSLLSLNKVFLLEKTSSNILTNSLDKEKILDNYIIVNHFSKDILKRYINIGKL